MSSQNYIKLNTGHLMPKVGYGSASCGEAIRLATRSALEVGYRSIDTAYFYMNEIEIGEELQNYFSKGKLKREDVFVTSKLPSIANRPKDVSRFLDMSLKKLQLDYLDLYLIHHPFGLKCLDDNNVFGRSSNGDCEIDFDTDLESIWKELEKQVEAGKVKAIGVSNFNISQIQRIMKIAKIPLAVNQIEVHGYFQQRPLVENCRELGVAIMAYSPLGAPYTKEGRIPPILLENPKVLRIAESHGKSSGQILLKFLLQQDIIVIPKSGNPDRIKSNFEFLDFNLSEEEMESLTSIDKGEEGRVYHFKEDFKGIEKHKEYPFNGDV